MSAEFLKRQSGEGGEELSLFLKEYINNVINADVPFDKTYDVICPILNIDREQLENKIREEIRARYAKDIEEFTTSKVILINRIASEITEYDKSHIQECDELLYKIFGKKNNEIVSRLDESELNDEDKVLELKEGEGFEVNSLPEVSSEAESNFELTDEMLLKYLNSVDMGQKQILLGKVQMAMQMDINNLKNNENVSDDQKEEKNSKQEKVEEEPTAKNVEDKSQKEIESVQTAVDHESKEDIKQSDSDDNEKVNKRGDVRAEMLRRREMRASIPRVSEVENKEDELDEEDDLDDIDDEVGNQHQGVRNNQEIEDDEFVEDPNDVSAVFSKT